MLHTGYDENVPWSDDMKEASRQRTVLHARLYNEVESITVPQQTMMEIFRLAFFREQIQPSAHELPLEHNGELLLSALVPLYPWQCCDLLH